jgi:hypothetical protein
MKKMNYFFASLLMISCMSSVGLAFSKKEKGPEASASAEPGTQTRGSSSADPLPSTNDTAVREERITPSPEPVSVQDNSPTPAAEFPKDLELARPIIPATMVAPPSNPSASYTRSCQWISGSTEILTASTCGNKKVCVGLAKCRGLSRNEEVHCEVTDGKCPSASVCASAPNFFKIHQPNNFISKSGKASPSAPASAVTK